MKTIHVRHSDKGIERFCETQDDYILYAEPVPREILKEIVRAVSSLGKAELVELVDVDAPETPPRLAVMYSGSYPRLARDEALRLADDWPYEYPRRVHVRWDGDRIETVDEREGHVIYLTLENPCVTPAILRQACRDAAKYWSRGWTSIELVEFVDVEGVVPPQLGVVYHDLGSGPVRANLRRAIASLLEEEK